LYTYLKTNVLKE